MTENRRHSRGRRDEDSMDDEERLRLIAHEAAEETLRVQGMDVENWREKQRDMDYLRRWRQGSEAAGSKCSRC